MTVKELKTRLEQLPEDKEVLASDEDGNAFEVLSVSLFGSQIWVSLTPLEEEDDN